jgi:tetratricopeptide (TPR) repeat protein
MNRPILRGLLSAGLAACLGAAAWGARSTEVDRERGRTFYTDARGYVATYAYDAAVGSIRQAETFDPDSADIRAYRDRLQRIHEAFGDRLRRKEDGHVFFEGVSKYVGAEYATSLLCLASALGAHPLDEQLRRFIRAVEKESGFVMDPDNVRPPDELVSLKLDRSEKAFHENRLTDALILCREAVLLAPNNSLGYKRLGSVYYARREADKAREAWVQAFALDPEDAELKDFLSRLNDAAGAGPSR